MPPLYTYECANCAIVELRHPPGRPPKEHECGGSLTRLWSVPAVRFKGSGFYATDSKPKR